MSKGFTRSSFVCVASGATEADPSSTERPKRGARGSAATAHWIFGLCGLLARRGRCRPLLRSFNPRWQPTVVEHRMRLRPIEMRRIRSPRGMDKGAGRMKTRVPRSRRRQGRNRRSRSHSFLRGRRRQRLRRSCPSL